ncbi:MAG: hypothetical protein C0429_09265 [Sphingopyxis sp.]|jgi:hypothetical protein|nr:hypothetical protein [Sphingopyxis sp.]
MIRRWLSLLNAGIFGLSTMSVLNGDFVGSDLPVAVHFDHAIANGIEALGWLIVFTLYTSRYAFWAGRLGLFLVGMWLWDMATTLPLQMPLPPLQNVWGPLALALQLYTIWPLLGCKETK